MPTLRHIQMGQKLGIENYFSKQYLAFKIIGLNLTLKTRVMRECWKMVITGFSMFFIALGICHYVWHNNDNLNLITDALGPFVQTVLSYWKIFILIYKRKEMVELLDYIWTIIEKTTDENLIEIISKESKKEMRVSGTYFNILMTTFAMAVISPFATGIFSYVISGEYVYKPILTASYPLKLDSLQNFSILFVWNLCGLIFPVWVTIAVDCMYSWGVHNISIQFRVLQQKFKNLAILKSKFEDQGFITASIIDCIKYHQEIIALSERLDRVYRPIVLAEFTMNSSQICFIVYQIGVGVDIAKYPFLIGFVVTILIQLLLYCYAGQHLEDQSQQVALEAYESLDWQFWTIRHRKMLLLTMIRAQQPCKMTAIFFHVNMSIFVWVIRSATSYVALLWSVG